MNHRSDEETEHDMNTGIPLRMPATDENPLQARVDELEAEVERLREENAELQALLDESDKNFWKVVRIANRAMNRTR